MPKSLVGFKKDYTLIWIMRAPRDTLDRIKMVGGGDIRTLMLQGINQSLAVWDQEETSPTSKLFNNCPLWVFLQIPLKHLVLATYSRDRALDRRSDPVWYLLFTLPKWSYAFAMSLGKPPLYQKGQFSLFCDLLAAWLVLGIYLCLYL